MHSQLTVRLSQELDRALAAEAARRRRKRSEIVRMALEEFLGASHAEADVPAARVRSLVGSLESGIPDLAESHRAHLLEALKRGR